MHRGKSISFIYVSVSIFIFPNFVLSITHHRELLVSIRFNEAGCQWSGCFLPDHLGDTQVKMRNNVSGAVNMIRVEVQNADIPVQDETIGGSLHGNSGTNMILLSDDDTGFMPYRIDNFSKEVGRCSMTGLIVTITVLRWAYAWDSAFLVFRPFYERTGLYLNL